MKYLYILSFVFISCLSYAQEDFNFEVLANVEIPEGGNDIWGYVDEEDGTEYAIVGTRENTRIYSLSDPTAPLEVARIRGATTTWRDMKSWKDHVYVTADSAPDGVVIIDMSQAPDSISYRFWNPIIPTTNGIMDTLASCHNLYIDENGFMYLAGCRVTDGNKAIIYDLNEDRSNPTLVGIHGGDGNEYAHDLMVQDNIMYSSEIRKGALVLWDVSDKANIEYLGEAPTSFDFTHNAWVSDDGNYVYTTDERSNAFVDAYDISDYTDIKRLDKFQPFETANRDVIPHNTHFIDDYLVTSWYTDGVVITDASRPNNLIKVGSFDTWLGEDGGFNGCWGAYPYLPSGLVLANDRESGLYVLQPTYVRACHLEGVVTDIDTGLPINGVTVQIVTDESNENKTEASGDYKTGLANAGTYEVVFSHPEYENVVVEVELENGVLKIQDVQMKILPFSISGIMVSKGSNTPIENGIISIEVQDRRLSFKSDSTGRFSFATNSESHKIIAGSWGYKHLVKTFEPSGDEELILEMKLGYMDDFIFDFGWQVTGDATDGFWERGVPIRTEFIGTMSNIGSDVSGDIGDIAYVTGNGRGEVRTDDVDGGSTILTSPEMFVEAYDMPHIEYRTYFYNAGGNETPNDYMHITVSDGEYEVLEVINTNTDTWTDKRYIDLSADPLLDLTKPITISFNAADIPGSNLVECGLDAFRVLEGLPSSLEDLGTNNYFKVYPNPAIDILYIETEMKDIALISLFNELGQELYSSEKLSSIDLSDYKSGTYLVSITMENGVKYHSKVIVNK